jgi:hypothetical protein
MYLWVVVVVGKLQQELVEQIMLVIYHCLVLAVEAVAVKPLA